MKRVLLFSLLLCVPHIVGASPAIAPVRVVVSPCAEPGEKMPQASELLDHLFDVYEGARTFRGTFDINAYGRDTAGGRSTLAFGFKLQTLVRFNENGDLTGEVSHLEYRNPDPKQAQTLNLVDDGQNAHLVFVEQKAWQNSVHDSAPMLREIIQPVLQEIVNGLRAQDDLKLKVSRGKDAGRAVFNVKAQVDDGSLRVVVDAQTRALRLIQMDSDNNSLTMRATDQAFDGPVTDTEFVWHAGPELHEVQPGEIELPQALRASKGAKKPE